MLPTVDFCGLNATRMILGANPFGGFSHQGKQRNEEMKAYHTVDRILETWERAEAAGLNTMVANNETPHVVEAVTKYIQGGGKLQWIAQINAIRDPNMIHCIDVAAEIGCKALFFHGRQTEGLYSDGKDAETLKSWVDRAHSHGLPVGVAAHVPYVHDWVGSLNLVDFHVVCFFNCGSLHDGKGEKFKLADVAEAVKCIQRIEKPCIGYKIMGAGRIDPLMAFEYAFENIKDSDIVNVGMHRGDKDDMIEENVGIVEGLLK